MEKYEKINISEPIDSRDIDKVEDLSKKLGVVSIEDLKIPENDYADLLENKIFKE